MKKIVFFAPLFCFLNIATLFADVENADFAQSEYINLNALTPAQQANMIATLENDLRILDVELDKCKRKKKGWIAATVIGSVGVVSTGVAAAVQGVQIKKKKENLSGKQEELKSLKEEKERLQ